MKYKIGDLVTVCDRGHQYEGLIIKKYDEKSQYYIFVYELDGAYWYRETDLK